MIPPLRERYEDLPALCSALLQRISDESDLPAPKLAPGTLEQLCLLPLYGNVRELENLLHRAVALCDGDCLRLDDIQSPINNTSALDTRAAALPSTSPDAPLPTDLQAHLDQQERDILVKILKETGFNRTVAAARLGLSLRQIRYRIARLKIDAPGDADPDA